MEPRASGRVPRGHRALPHTADIILEAWAPTLCACLEEAVAGLVESFADTSGVETTDALPVSFEAARPDELLVRLLEEVVYVLDVLGVVPVTAAIEPSEAGGVAGRFEVAPVSQVEVVGAVPKAVARSGLAVEEIGSAWRARVLVDV